ncbi:hypothetical protein EVAR_2374_1 [Eumeta japonica]|uniref:Uncharacterized protein n=1 Tax=Eumeta variegata TaxID=151549 RepID=A0A4C1SJ16_EUMVA|nr:hypothetical protein EVAR_2374_1 [Eumeta japonica]
MSGVVNGVIKYELCQLGAGRCWRALPRLGLQFKSAAVRDASERYHRTTNDIFYLNIEELKAYAPHAAPVRVRGQLTPVTDNVIQSIQEDRVSCRFDFICPKGIGILK